MCIIVAAAYVRFQIAGNFLGLPAVTIPVEPTSFFIWFNCLCNNLFASLILWYQSQVGYDKSGMPIGLQFIGPPWSEATLLHLAFAMQVRYCSHSLLL